jgi:hypothetical protein
MPNLAWPWVSRRAYLAVVDERDRLRDRVDALTDNIVGLARVEHRLPERRPEQRTKREPTPLPTELRNLISGFRSPLIQAQMEHEIRNQLRAGANPKVLTEYVRGQLGVTEMEA